MQLVETELQTSKKRLVDEIADLKATHASDMQKLVDARTAKEGALQTERNEAVRKLEIATKRHQDELQSARGQADVALASLWQVDTTLASKFPSHSVFFIAFLLSELQMPGPIPKLLQNKLSQRTGCSAKAGVLRLKMLQPGALKS